MWLWVDRLGLSVSQSLNNMVYNQNKVLASSILAKHVIHFMDRNRTRLLPIKHNDAGTECETNDDTDFIFITYSTWSRAL